jgi:hypothetical protein
MFPALEPLPYYIRGLCLNRLPHFSPKCAFYKNMMCVAITGVDNGRPGVGFETMNMSANVKMNGRSYHFLPNSNTNRCGIANFVHDELVAHIDEVNAKQSKEVTVNKEFANEIKCELSLINPFIRDCIAFGQGLSQINTSIRVD